MNLDYANLIERAAKSQRPLYELSNDIFILGPTASFSGWEENSFELITSIANFFNVSVRTVHFCGSAKLGFSPIKLHNFVEGKSDLDVAILDAHCFRRYHELVLLETKQMRFRHKFPWRQDRQSGERVSMYDSFMSYIAKGVFRPDLMPDMDEKVAWLSFFNELSRTHKGRYRSISAAIYLSDVAFNLKQADALQSFVEKKGFL